MARKAVLCFIVLPLLLLTTYTYAQETANLTVRSRYGSPDPPVGIHTYPVDTEITSSVTTPVYGSPGIRFVCTGYRARGSPETLPPTGTENSVTFTITMNTILTWTWKIQYLLTTTVSPGESGTVDVSPTSPDGYFDAKSTITLTANDNTGYDFGYWSGGLRGITNPQSMVLRGPRNVVAAFVLENRYFTVNPARGEPVPPVGIHQYYYNDLVTANCGTTPDSGGTGIQYVCTGYSGTGNLTDNPETSLSFTITLDSSVTWLWETQYYLTVVSAYGDPQGEGWHAAGTIAHWSVTNPWPAGTGVRYITETASGDVSMDSPQTVEVIWTTQFYLTIDSVYGDPQGAGWYDADSAAPWSVTSPWSGSPGIRYIADSASGSVLMNSPQTVTVAWTTQYYLTVTSIYGDPQGEGWYDEGTIAYWSVTNPLMIEPGVRYFASPDSGVVLMDAPRTVTVDWIMQYLLTYNSPSDEPVEQGWYEAGTTADWYAASPWPGDPGVRYIADPASGTILMDSPKSLVLSWSIQYCLTIEPSYGDPQGVGWYNPDETAYWSVTSPWPGDPGVSYFTEVTSGSVIMDSPHTITLTWVTLYYLTVVSPYGAPEGEDWYEAGETADWEVTSPWPGDTGVRYVTDPTSGSVLMDEPKTVTVLWTTQYCLTYNSPQGAPVEEGWYDAGTTANWNATSPWPGDTGIRYVADPVSGTILMDAPKNVTITWTTQYYLTVESSVGDPQGAGWHKAGTMADWSVTSPWTGITGVQYVTDPASGSILMDGPKTLIIPWITQYQLATAVDPYETGSVSPASGSWFNAGTVVSCLATPNPGYAFLEWSGDLSGSTNPRDLTMTFAKSITARFVLIPVADFAAAPTTGNIPLTVLFTDMSTGPITSWSWNFGSGASPATANTQGPHSVTYSTVGLKTVTLTVTGPGGSDVQTRVDYINALPVVPVADFSATPRSAVVGPLTVQFTDESIGEITSWAWDFDNNGVYDSTERNPSYTYTGTGRYTVKLTVTGPGGSNDAVRTGYIRICTATIYVDVARPNDSGDGLSWATAKKTIQAGLDAASNDYAVRVANGTYSGDLNKNLDFLGKAIHLKSEGGATNCIIDCGTSGLRRGFYFHTSETALSVVEGFKIQKGYSDNGGGGGIVCFSASPTIANCTITICDTTGEGGGIYCNNSSSVIRNCTITSNTAADNAGGICVAYSSGVRIVGCTVQTNTTTTADVSNGGGIYTFQSIVRITNCTITGNTAPNWGAGIYCVNSTAKITGCAITNNTASDSGGGIFYGGLNASEISNCTISGNTASVWGGGIFCGMDSAPVITNCTITGNRSYDSGGGILCYKAGPFITNCTIRDNIATYYGGGIELDLTCNPRITNCTITNNTAANGAGLDLYTRSVPIITNCTIANNSATTSGGGIFAKCGSAPSINNTIIWGNNATSLGRQIYTGNSGCVVTLNYCDYASNTLNSNNIVGLGTVTTNNCIVADPLFVDATNKNYRLTASSPCINMGNNSYVPAGVTTDLDGNPRIVNGTVDIGAYERQP